MATAQEAVRRLKIEVTGADQAAAKLEKVSAQQAGMAVSAAGATKATGQLEAQLASSLARYDAIIRQQVEYNRALATNVVAANDNSRSISESGLKWAEWTNHVKVAGEAAYVMSPKFRGLVSSMAGPALGVATTAIETAALGVVRGTNLAGKGLVELGVGVARTSTILTPFAAQMAVTGAAMAAWNPTLTSVAASILGRFLPAISAVLRVVAPILIVKDAIGLVTEAWRLGGEKLDEYRAIATKAAAVDLSTSYFQKLVKGAEAAKVPVDALTKAFTTLQAASADQLGGSALQQRLNASVKVGNFAGNTGVTAFAAANTTQEKFEAIAKLINQAMRDGQRLAALDIAGTAFGPEAVANLRKDSEYFDRIVASTAKIGETQIVSDADVGRALDLQRRYDAAVAILEQRWHPIQNLLTELGIKMQSAWVGIVESIASGIDWVTKLVMKIGEIPQTFWDYAKSGIHVAAKSAAVAGFALGPLGAPVGLAASAVAYATSDSGPAAATDARADATNRLAAGLKNANAVTQAAAETNAVYNAVLRDTSHAIDGVKKAHAEAADAVDRAINSVTRHIELQKADAQAVGLGDAALASFRVQAAETAAVQANGGKETAAQADAFARLKVEAGAAAEALARAKIDNTISRGRQTALLAPEDVQIASQLKGIYPDVATALGSVEASALRTNTALSTISSSTSSTLVTGLTDILDGTKSLSQGFADLSKAIIRALEEAVVKMMIVAPIMRGLQGLMGGFLGGSSPLSLISPGVSGSISAGTVGGTSGVLGNGLYNVGGYTGHGGKYEPAGIVHRGEYVFDAAATSHIGVDALDQLRGYAGGGYVTPDHVLPFRRAANDDAGAPVFNLSIEGAPSQPTVTQKQNDTGGMDINVAFATAVKGVLLDDAGKNGDISQAFAKRQAGFGGR